MSEVLMNQHNVQCSVVLPYYRNREPLLHTLHFLLQQQQHQYNFEIIIVDDGNSDPNIVNYIEEIDQRRCIRLITYDENKGSAFARNYGVKHARGTFVIFLDSDQVVKPDFIFRHCEFLSLFPIDVPVLQMSLRKEIPHAPEHIDDVETLVVGNDSRCAVFERYSENLQVVHGAWHLCFSHNLSIRRSHLIELNMFDENIFKGWGLEDSEFAYNLKKNGAKIAYNPAVCAYHLQHELNWNSEDGFAKWDANLSAFIEKHSDSEVYSQVIFRDFFNPKLREKRLQKGDPRPWLTCYQKFEESVRLVNDVEYPPVEITIKKPTVADLLERLEANPSLAANVIVSEDSAEIIAFVQTHPAAKKLRLFTY